MTRFHVFSSIAALAFASFAGCMEVDTDSTPEVVSNQDSLTWDEFMTMIWDEPDSDVFIVNGDEPIVGEKNLIEFYENIVANGGLIVHQSGGSDAKWSNSQKNNLTYCVSNSGSGSFGNNYSTAVNAMNAATAAWEADADINFIHDTSQDGNCTASNGNVVFDVRSVSGQSYLARAFFPDQSRSTRNILVDTSTWSSSWSPTNILIHELGHALGFRHEHTRPESGQCFEDNNWRELTDYDSASTMHYPQCGGSASTLALTNTDRCGIALLYGGTGTAHCPAAPECGDGVCNGSETSYTCEADCGAPGVGTPQSGSASGSVGWRQWVHYTALTVEPGTAYNVAMTGNNDADLYVRFGAQATTSAYDCRPYLGGSNETCSGQVPNGETTMHVSVRGYSFWGSNYSLALDWIGGAP